MVLESYIAFRRRVACLMAAESAEIKMGINQVILLYRLLAGPATASELVSVVSSDKAAVSRSLNLLEKQGVIKRQKSGSDRRVAVIDLTEKGERMARACRRIRGRVAAQLDSSLTKEERLQLSRLIAKITV